MSVRLAVTGVALVAVATGSFYQPEKPPSTDGAAKSAPKTSQPRPQRAEPRFVGSRDAEAARILGLSPDELYDRPSAPPPTRTTPPPRTPGGPPAPDTVTRFALAAIVLVVVPPAFLYAMIWFVGLTVLPTYFDYFEKPQPPGPPA